MKILQVTSSNFFSTYGGGQVYVKNLVDEMVRQNITPSIAMPFEGDNAPSHYRGCPIVTFDRNASLGQITDLLNLVKPDIVHLHGFKALFSEACQHLGVRCIVTAHHGGIVCPAGTLLNHRDEICKIPASPQDCLPCVLRNIRGGIWAYPLLKHLHISVRLQLGELTKRLPFIYYLTPVLLAQSSIERKRIEWSKIYTYADRIIAPSNAIADSMIRNKCEADKISVIPHGIPIPENSIGQSGNLISKKEMIRFFYVGRICHVKGVHVMLEAFSKLNKDDRAELHIVGGAGNKTEERYMSRLRRKYINNLNIIWYGKVEPSRISEMIRHWDIMIHPTICLEIFGLNIAEALAMGKPVIATRCGGAEMQIEDGVNGWLMEPNDALMLQNAIEDTFESGISENMKHSKPVISITRHIQDLMRVYEA